MMRNRRQSVMSSRRALRSSFDACDDRIRPIEAKALRKLKHRSRSRKLRRFLDN
jgi:DNA-directed RNA polymerase sigma subunit (sigma70/sigma32)